MPISIPPEDNINNARKVLKVIQFAQIKVAVTLDMEFQEKKLLQIRIIDVGLSHI